MRIDNPIISGSLIVSGSTTITGVLSASSFIGDGSGLIGVTSYTDSDTLDYINSIGVLSGSIDWNTLEGKPSGIVSSSSQVSFTTISDKPTLVSGSSQINFASISNKPTLVSGSSQIIYNQISNIPSGIISSSNQLSNQTIPGNLTITNKLTAQEFHTEFVSASIIYESGSTKFGDSSDDIHSFTGSLNVLGKISATTINNVVSSSAQISFTTISDKPTLISGSSQIDLTQTTNYVSGIKTRLNSENVVSGSSQIIYNQISSIPNGIVSGSSQIIYNQISSIPNGIVSGSSQISALGFTTCTGTVTSVTAGTYLTGGTITTTGTIAVDATNVNTASKIVARDASGNFCAGTITATSFVGDGSGLTGISGVTINNNTDNYLLTATGTTGTVNGEANLTFNGSTLSLTGNLVSTGTGTSFRNRIGIGDGNGTPFTNAGSPGIWLSYNGASDQFIGACSSTVFGVYIGAWRMCVSNTGTVTATCFVETSAQKFKTDIETFSCTDYFNCLRPVSFKWKETGNEDIGFIAEEVNEYYPTLVAKNLEDEPTGVKYTKIVPLLVKKIQEQSEQINQLSIELKDIYNKINKDI